MNILFISHYSGSKHHGMGLRHYYLAKRMVELGHEVTIIASSYSHLRQHQPKVKDQMTIEYIDGIKYLWLKTNKYNNNGLSRIKNMFQFTWLLLKNSKKISEENKPDFIIEGSTYMLTFYPALLISKFSTAKLLFEVRDIWPSSLIDIGGYSKYHPFIMLLQFTEDFAYKHTDKVVSALPMAVKHMVKHGMKENKFAYIPNGIIPYSLSHLKLNMKLPDQHLKVLEMLKEKYSFILGYTGTHGEANSIDIFIKTALALKGKNICAVFIGDGNAKEKFIKFAKDNSADNVYFLPPLDKELVPLALEYFTMGLVGGRVRNVHKYGVSPNKLMDYMFAKLPVVLAIKTEYSPVHTSKGGIVVDPSNANNIALAIEEQLDKDKNELIIMGQNAKKFIEKEHDYKILSERYISVMENIPNSKGS